MQTATSYHLSPAELEQLDRDGYVIRESLFTREECAEINDVCEALVAKLVEDRKGKRYHVGAYTFEPDMLTGVMIKWEGDKDVVHGLEPFSHLEPKIAEWGMDRRFVDPMVAFTGDADPCLFTEKLNLKRAHHGGANPWHQDHPYWIGDNPHAAHIATAMLFLDDASLENGTLQVLPGSHKSGQWGTRDDQDAFGNLEMDPSLPDDDKAVAVEVPAGSVVYFGAFLVHKSHPNTSDRDRRSLLYSYQPAGYPHSYEAMKRYTKQNERVDS